MRATPALIGLNDVELDLATHLVDYSILLLFLFDLKNTSELWTMLWTYLRWQYNKRIIIMWIALKLVSKIIADSSRDVPSYWRIFFRSSHQRCSVRKTVLRNFAKFTWKHLYQSLFLNKVAVGRLLLFLWHLSIHFLHTCQFVWPLPTTLTFCTPGSAGGSYELISVHPSVCRSVRL